MSDIEEHYHELKNKYIMAIKEKENLTINYQLYQSKVRKIQDEIKYLIDVYIHENSHLQTFLTDSSDEEEYFTINQKNMDYMERHPPQEPSTPPQEEHSLINNRKRKKSDLSQGDRKRRRKPGKRVERTDAKPIEKLPMDEEGNLSLPLTIGKGMEEVTIHNIGHVIWDREGYHSQRYIFPVGFKSTKLYPSMIDVTRKTVYTSEILDGGENPIFQVTAEDQPEKKFTAGSASGVWKIILDSIMAKGLGVKTHASGPQMIGLSNLGITKYIQELPGAEKCQKYVMQRWIKE